MPRSGAGIFSVPVGTDGVTDTTIESAKYNTFVHDVETDLNAPRPIVAGGTGASNAHDALIALNGEEAGQLVDNYDTFPFVAGSFYSNPGATSAPDNTNYFSGVCHVHSHGGAITLEASVQAPAVAAPLHYVRQKFITTWGPWFLTDQAVIDLANTKVSKAGDTMTGDLTIDRSGDDTGALNFGTSGSSYLYWAGGQFYLSGGPISIIPPINPQHAATKQYADTKLPLSGGGLTGPITLNNGTSDSPRLSLVSSGFASWGIYTASGFFRIYSDGIGSALEFDTNGRATFAVSPQVPEPDTNSSAATVNYVNNKFANVSGYLPLTGGTLSGSVTFNGGISVNLPAGSVDSGGFGSFIVQGPNDAYMTFHRTGVYAVNFGLSADGNFWYGGISAGTGTRWRFWTTKDFTALPASGTRLLFAADTTPTAGHDPYPGAVMASLATNNTIRYRYVQTFNGSTWVTVALA